MDVDTRVPWVRVRERAGDIQLTLCQSVPFDAAVVVTTPQKLAFIDVAKGIRMFARMAVPCVAVAENMSYFDADGQRFYPFGKVRPIAANRNTRRRAVAASPIGNPEQPLPCIASAPRNELWAGLFSLLSAHPWIVRQFTMFSLAFDG